MEGLALFVVLLLIGLVTLPIVALVRSSRINERMNRLEEELAAMRRARLFQTPVAAPPAELPAVVPLPEPVPPAPASPEPLEAISEPAAPRTPEPTQEPAPPPVAEPAFAFSDAPVAAPVDWEQLIGRKWIGWVAVALLFGAALYFLKYAFDNRWIGELGRVAIGVAAGLALVWTGHNRHRAGWRYIAQILNGGGSAILYLSVYGAFAYYHLIDQRAAFFFLAVVVAETHIMAALYRAPAVAAASIFGGFLIPVLLSTGHDQYKVLFSYILLLDAGTLALLAVRRWRGLSTFAYLCSQALFLIWFGENYHPEKRLAVLLFQAALFVLFTAADYERLWQRRSGVEEWLRAIYCPFTLFGVCYGLLEEDYHAWMAPMALSLAALQAAMAYGEQRARASDRRILMIAVGVALTLITVAIPIQLDTYWITLAWAVEGAALVWAAFETNTRELRLAAGIVFAVAVLRFLGWDVPWAGREPFTPLFNRFFFTLAALTTCLLGAARLSHRVGEAAWTRSLITLAGILFWLGSSMETYGWFGARAMAALRGTGWTESVRQLSWAGQLALSFLWTTMAGALTAAGFRVHSGKLRAAGLALFGITVIKALIIDIGQLRQFYRILALLGLGAALLAVAWAYQRTLRRERAR